MKRLLITLCVLPFFLSSAGQVIFQSPLSPRLTGYDISAVLDADSHKITADMKAFWVNHSEKPVDNVMMHLYLNAFSSNKSSFAATGRWSPAGDEGWGYVRIITVSDLSGHDLVDSMQYVSPDDDNEFDRTVVRITLAEVVQPHDTLWLQMKFESKLPSPIVRTGFNKDFHFVGQWFPKFGVYETAGMRQRTDDGWNCHQFHPNSEFYSNHSVYNVSVTLPSGYVCGSGGATVEEIDNGDGTKKVVWHAEDIVDFAWTAWPGYKVVKDKWRGVDITLLTTKEALKNSGWQIEALKNALEFLDNHVGPYPWPHVTFVDPPVTGSGAGGMEYTTLFTSVPSASIPDFFNIPEMVTIHEFSHSYFMGMLASNEFEEPWVDEGINSYWEFRIVDNYYGNGHGILVLPFLKMADRDYGRVSYVTSSNRQVATNDLTSWEYPHGTYSMMSYNKTSVWLSTLEGLIGTETMDNVFREYYRQWAFRHPSGRDFIDVVNKVVREEHGDRFGTDMNWYFDQVLYGSGICDYRVSDVSARKITGYSGIVEGDTVSFTRTDRKADTLYKSVVRLERTGDVKLPLSVLIGFDDGKTVLEQWDGKARYKDFSYEGTEKVHWAKLDPDYLIDMDVNRMNNSYTLEPDKAPLKRMMVKFITLMQAVISFMTI